MELSDALTNEHSRAATIAAISSSLGRECLLLTLTMRAYKAIWRVRKLDRLSSMTSYRQAK